MVTCVLDLALGVFLVGGLMLAQLSSVVEPDPTGFTFVFFHSLSPGTKYVVDDLGAANAFHYNSRSSSVVAEGRLIVFLGRAS